MCLYKIEQVRVSVDFTQNSLMNKIVRILQIFPNDIIYVKVLSKSLDARKKPPVNVVSVEISLKKPLIKNFKFVKSIESSKPPFDFKIYKNITRPVIIGFGPAGISAAYFLSKAGQKPIVFERGGQIAKRQKDVDAFWDYGILDKESNVLFGEGGAGLFSDGKLTSRSKDVENRKIFLEMLVRHGADKSVLTDMRAHIGTDALAKVLASIRNEILEFGGEINFDKKLTDIKISQKKLIGIFINGEFFETQNAILAIGHSARGTCKTLEKYLTVEAKPFAIGVRVEFEQEIINRLRYGNFTKNLSPASYALTFRRKNPLTMRACYTFCMCPGGRVIACSARKGFLSTNGMSYSQRNLRFGNAAFLIPVNPGDFLENGKSALDCAVGFLENIERKSFERGGKNYSIPAQNLASFCFDKENKFDCDLSPRRYEITDISGILPKFAEQTLKVAIPQMLDSMGKISFERAAVFAAETGSSSAVRIVRNSQDLQSIDIAGIFPCGEGAGYAGGIVSSGIDGIKCAKRILC
ncbi:MAG: hypothetical protein LBH98_07030 [Chitinispirillales bacterium]|jgi:uncharacterized FAD-dependent dehydrogenase|nr:hypothetical protein [Chitinispirillales bacterium]